MSSAVLLTLFVLTTGALGCMIAAGLLSIPH